MKYRPWGPVDWALSLSNQKPWRFVGAIGTEERSIASWRHLKDLGVLQSELLVEIEDVESAKYRDRILSALEERYAQFTSGGGNLASISRMKLMSELFHINDFSRKAESSCDSVVLDITSLPKRFFFPLLRSLSNSTNIRNLLITYTSPASYAPENEPLYEDIENWRALPGFGGTGITGAQWIVSVGFLVESLRKYVGDAQDAQMKLLIPFPAPLAALRRTWESVASLEGGHKNGRFEKFRVESLDMSAAFDRITQLSGTPEKPLAFAPFGPKPTSAAMCLYAMQRNSSVHYPQPTVYHPEYSRGIRNNDSAEAINAYWVKHEGESLYEI